MAKKNRSQDEIYADTRAQRRLYAAAEKRGTPKSHINWLKGERLKKRKAFRKGGRD